MCPSLAYLASQFVLDRAHVSERRVPPLGVVEVVDPLRDRPLRAVRAAVALVVEELVGERAEAALDHRVVPGVARSAHAVRVVFPVHPRTAKTIREIGALPTNLLLVDPQPYLEFNSLVKHATAVITDSGGITEETTVIGVPCMTLRSTTERPETVSIGTNELLGGDPAALKPALDRLLAGEWKRGQIPLLWDGRTGDRIVDVLVERFGRG